MSRTTTGQGLGEFEAHGDVGQVKTAGTVAYDTDTGAYTLTGSGTNMWAGSDEFFFVWKKMRGDLILSADAEFPGEGVEPHRKLGWMIRASLDTDSPYVDIARHGDGLTSLQFRRDKGAETEQIVAEITAADVLQLERRGRRYVMSVARRGDTFETAELTDIELPDEVYVGLFICAHNPDVVETGRFTNVRVTVPAPDDFTPYRDYYGSRLEIMDVDTGLRRVVHTETDSLQAPNWTRDGKALIYNRNGALYRFDIATGAVSKIDTGFATDNNNDHVISFDGTQLAISDQSDGHGGVSQVFTVPIGGGVPKLVTKQGPSYFHGWSPDGRWLVYTGGRDGAWDIYKIRSNGSGDEIRLTDNEALDDGPEFSPDGKWIYFNSTRGGHDGYLAHAPRRVGPGTRDERRVQQLVPPRLSGRDPARLPGLPARRRARGTSVVPPRVPDAAAGRRRRVAGDRQRLRRPGHDQRAVLVTGRQADRVRLEHGVPVRRYRITRAWAGCRDRTAAGSRSGPASASRSSSSARR